MGALSKKTVLLVTHQVDFLPDFNSVLVSILEINNRLKCTEHLFIQYFFPYSHNSNYFGDALL